ncbi:glycosyltransferase family 4 protein [Paenibacillus sp. GSMTC-2017]|uniref:glycosyltransferase family 4 protein n=1 Tax=Paenibacillus sp. GSMTC-2017 TaxID=2794350 RepID=UPI0018D62823|nr:glycosyltransferase family 4 protein [Paenibacillus sp. GSMTC-2017]MBH5317308.1 glycosyltransferase family 4 protein [Paenibacillus sp. GSMTC-2017]
MKPKVLFCATVDYHFKAFHLPVMEWFQKQGWEVHVVAQGDLVLPHVDHKYNIPIQRSPFKVVNVKAYRQLKSIIDKEDYSIIHCHTPMGGALARMAARGARKRGTKVIYTAHGFHFYKGAPQMNWLFYYPIEKMLASVTDCLITINGEDFRRALASRFRAREIHHVHGVGVHTNMYSPITEERKRELRSSLGYSSDHFLMIYGAEFNTNKNHELLIHALAKLKEKVPEARLLLAGEGSTQESCRELTQQLGVSHMVNFLGFRNDMRKLIPMCDVAVASSLREGLPLNIMEAMASGLPIVATNNRGHIELVEEGQNGFLIDPSDVDAFASRLQLLYTFHESRLEMGRRSLERVKVYSLDSVKDELKGIYNTFMTEQERDGKERLEWNVQ